MGYKRMRVALGLLCFGLLDNGLCAEPVTQTIEPGIHELSATFRVSDEHPADVSWDIRQPLDLAHVSRTAKADGWTLFVFVAEAGQTYVVDSDVIDWQDRERTKTRYVVRVANPDPNPNPKPNPTPLAGLAKDVYDAAIASNLPRHEFSRIAQNFAAIESKLAAVTNFSIGDAQAELDSLNRELGLKGQSWRTFGEKLGEFLAIAKTRQETITAMAQIATGLEAVKP